MPNIRPISDLKNCPEEISEFCNMYQKPVFIVKNDECDLVVISKQMYETLDFETTRLKLYEELADDEDEDEDEDEDFRTVAKELRERLVDSFNGRDL